MKKPIQFAARLYPPGWRRRYGVEFDAFLEDAGSGWRDMFDLLKGAIVMQMNRTAMLTVCSLAGLLLAFAAYQTMPARYASTASFTSTSAIPAKVVDEALRNVPHGSISSFPAGKPSLDNAILFTFFPRDRAASDQVLHDVFSALKNNSIPVTSIFGTHPQPAGPDPLWMSAGGLAAGLLLGLLAAWTWRPRPA